jgi:hypothetical protein
LLSIFKLKFLIGSGGFRKISIAGLKSLQILSKISTQIFSHSNCGFSFASSNFLRASVKAFSICGLKTEISNFGKSLIVCANFSEAA